MRVGIFDSGVGGLSVFKDVRSHLPNLVLSYCCDNLNFPYGTKSDEQVRQCSVDVMERFASKAKLDLLVIACNTASTIALEDARQALKIPVIGVVPAIKPAAQSTKSNIIGIIATPATIRRPYLENLIKEFAPHSRVIRVGSSRLVELAEQKLRGEKISWEDVRHELAPIAEAAKEGLDQLVLGCTHFPLLKEEFSMALPSSVHLVDSGVAIARRVEQLIQGQKITSEQEETVKGYTSGEPLVLEFHKNHLPVISFSCL